MNVGRVVQVIGPTVDVAFDPDKLPRILNAIRIEDAERGIDLTVEVALHVGDNMVRCIAMGSTDGLVRGMKAVDTGGPITVPVGEQCLGRLFNLLGEPIDGKAAGRDREALPDPPRRAAVRGAGDHDRACSRPASRSSTCWRPTSRAARSACSAAPAWARPCSSRS